MTISFFLVLWQTVCERYFSALIFYKAFLNTQCYGLHPALFISSSAVIFFLKGVIMPPPKSNSSKNVWQKLSYLVKLFVFICSWLYYTDASFTLLSNIIELLMYVNSLCKIVGMFSPLISFGYIVHSTIYQMNIYLFNFVFLWYSYTT